MTRKVPEPNAELLSAEDVHGDVVALTELLEHRRAERRAYAILERPEVREMLNKLMASGTFASEEEVIERALRTLATAIAR